MWGIAAMNTHSPSCPSSVAELLRRKEEGQGGGPGRHSGELYRGASFVFGGAFFTPASVHVFYRLGRNAPVL